MFDKVSRLHEAEVRVVSQKQSGLMHHKFALVEGRMIITGSFKWTNQVWPSRFYCIYSHFFLQAIYTNNENVIISSMTKNVPNPDLNVLQIQTNTIESSVYHFLRKFSTFQALHHVQSIVKCMFKEVNFHCSFFHF